MATAAERQRRSRKHRSGDHSLCDPNRCDGHTVTPAVTSRVTPDKVSPRGLGTRGRRLWRETTDAVTLGPAERVLLEESCRIADRLDQMDRILRGDTDAWMRFRVGEDGTEVTVTLDKVLSEARAQAVALKQIVSELRQSAGKAQQPEREASGSDDLAQRREARRAAAGL